MAICKGCGEDTKLIKAHAIPESFFVKMGSEHGTPKIMTDIAGIFPKRSPIGIYDEKILCHKCESRFQIYDNYGCKILLKNEDEYEKLIKYGRVYGYKVNNVDYEKLKLFFISVLWRASISSQNFYSNINLGPYEQIAKELIWNNSSGDQSQFSFVLAKYTDSSIGKIMLDPHRDRWDGVNYCRFYMYGYILYIKVDKRNSPLRFRNFEMTCSGPFLIIGRDIKNSKELPVMISIIKNARK